MEKSVLELVELSLSSFRLAKRSVNYSSKWLNKTLPAIEVIEEQELIEKTIKELNELHQLISEKYESIERDLKKVSCLNLFESVLNPK